MTAGTGRSITRGRVRGASVALATMLLAGVAALAPAAAAVPALADAGAMASAHAATDATALQVRVEVNQISPQVLAPGQDLTVTATLTNTGTTALTQPRVLVHLARAGFISRSSLDRWRKAGTTGDLGVTVLTVDLTTPLAPGGTATVVATVPAGSVGLRTAATAWGPRGLALEVVDAADPARIRLGLVRTFTLWFPDQEVTPTQVSVLVPLVGGVPDDDAAATLEALTRTGGRLARVLDATAEHTSVSWAVDPALVEQSAASDAQEDDASQGTDGPGPATQAWGSALRTAVTGREVVLLPWGDADVTALAHARATEVLDQALARSRDVASSLGLPGTATDVITWPAEQLPDLATAAFMTSDASRAVVVGPGEMDAPAALTYTPSGRATVGASGRDVTVLIPDERLSTALTTGVVASAEDADAADMSQVTGATAAADLLAELAVITRERPNQSRGMLLTVPRTWAPDPAIAAAQLAALESAPWVRAEPITALVGMTSDVDRGTLPQRDTSAGEVSATDLAAVRDATEQRRLVAAMAQDPNLLLGDLDAEVLTPAALAWRADTAGRDAFVASSVAATQTLRDAVSVPPSSTVNLLSTSGEMRVRVANSLDQPVTVVVHLVPGDARLRADDPVTVTIPAAQEVTASIAVHAIQSADVDVVVRLTTVDGTVIKDSPGLVVRVRAEWEGIGTAVIGGLLAIGVVIGVIRTIRRGRGRRRGTPQAHTGPDDLSPEQAEDDALRTSDAHATPADTGVGASHDSGGQR